MVQGAVGLARDDMLKLSDGNDETHDARSAADNRPGGWPPESAAPGAAPATGLPEGNDAEPFVSSPAATAAAMAAASTLTASTLWKGTRALARVTTEAAFREAASLFRRRNGAPPPAPRLAVLMVLVLVVWARRRRRHAPQHARPPPPAAPITPQRNHAVVLISPTAGTAAAAGLSSPSRYLFWGSRTPGIPAPTVPGSPVRRRYDGPDGLDPSLPSPAQVRAAQARGGQARVRLMRRLERDGTERGIEEVPAGGGRESATVEAPCRRWGWGWAWWRWTGNRKPHGRGGRRQWLWLVLLWLVASVLEVGVVVCLSQVVDSLDHMCGGIHVRQ